MYNMHAIPSNIHDIVAKFLVMTTPEAKRTTIISMIENLVAGCKSLYDILDSEGC